MECRAMREKLRHVVMVTVVVLGILPLWGLMASPPDIEGLYINFTTKTWKDASRSCSLMGSDRSPSYDVIAREIPVLGSSYGGGRTQARTLYWIGATATFTPWVLNCSNICRYACGLRRFSHFKTRTDFIGEKNTANSSGQTWIDSVLRGLPLEGPGPGQWTPYTRRRLVRWTPGNENFPKRDACVSLWNNEIVLRPCVETFAYICQIKKDPITSASTTTSPSIGNEPRDRTDTTAKVDAIATTAMMSRDFTPALLPKNENEASVLPVIAGSVAAGCIFVLIIAAIIILRVKRRASSKQQSVSAATENVYYSGLADEQTRLQGVTPSSADDRMTDKTSPDSSERGPLVQGDEDGVYNHTWDKPITEQQTDHVYSSTHTGNEYDCVNSDVYNHTWDKPITEEITDHVYSSTSSGNDANVYDHTNPRNKNSSELNGDDYGVNPN